jgi:hypothetical protein
MRSHSLFRQDVRIKGEACMLRSSTQALSLFELDIATKAHSR